MKWYSLIESTVNIVNIRRKNLLKTFFIIKTNRSQQIFRKLALITQTFTRQLIRIWLNILPKYLQFKIFSHICEWPIAYFMNNFFWSEKIVIWKIEQHIYISLGVYYNDFDKGSQQINNRMSDKVINLLLLFQNNNLEVNAFQITWEQKYLLLVIIYHSLTYSTYILFNRRI